jgi:hypothetical protein
VDQVIGQGLPEALRTFMRDGCRIPDGAFLPRPGDSLPQPAKRLLVHAHDMTSTLAAFHESALRVEILQRRRQDDLYLREVFLRTVTSEAIVEYGVIAIALDEFTPPQQEAVQAGQMPLGALLHCFEIPFVSAPIGFFAITAEALAATPLRATGDSTCYGRFNRLTKPTGEPLAWILEILPHSTP